MGTTPSKLEDMLAYAGVAKFQTRVATKIHDVWRDSLPRRPDGTREPRLKTIRAKEPGEISRDIDIANTKFEDLPARWKDTNLNAARVMVSELLRHVKTKDLTSRSRLKKLDLPFIETAAHFTHQQWILEHQHSSDTAALIPYYLLPEKDKNLLRKLVRMTIDMYDPEKDRLDNTMFPPRDLVIVPLPPLKEDEDDGKPKPWDEVADDDENDEDVARQIACVDLLDCRFIVRHRSQCISQSWCSSHVIGCSSKKTERRRSTPQGGRGAPQSRRRRRASTQESLAPLLRVGDQGTSRKRSCVRFTVASLLCGNRVPFECISSPRLPVGASVDSGELCTRIF